METRLRKTLTRMGLTPRSGARFQLRIVLRDGEASCEIYDGGRGTGVIRRNIPFKSASAQDLALFARTLGDAAFTGD
jgi:hypothetical protein